MKESHPKGREDVEDHQKGGMNTRLSRQKCKTYKEEEEEGEDEEEEEENKDVEESRIYYQYILKIINSTIYFLIQFLRIIFVIDFSEQTLITCIRWTLGFY